MMSSEGNSLPSSSATVKRRVAYYYDPDIGQYSFGQDHWMKPFRIQMTHELIKWYGLLDFNEMEIHVPRPALDVTLLTYHTKSYIDAIHDGASKFSMGDDDCPTFDGLDAYCKKYVGGSIAGAIQLNHGLTDIAINWSGGMHHAMKEKASGFCYINDIVLAILELLKHKKRVLYVDIDVHHGDGVEAAFYTTNRVMTVSFHKHGKELVRGIEKDFFPSTGHIRDAGIGEGEGYSLNIPFEDGVDDKTYVHMFESVIGKVMDFYQPEAVVLQCGADSLAGDLLGPFNLTIEGHGKCVEYIRSFNVPLLLLGGGGYNIGNVARCWCYETGIALGVKIDDNMPKGVYPQYFGPDYKLHFPPSGWVNRNTSEDVEETLRTVTDRLSALSAVPGIQFQERLADTEIAEVDEDAVFDDLYK